MKVVKCGGPIFLLLFSPCGKKTQKKMSDSNNETDPNAQAGLNGTSRAERDENHIRSRYQKQINKGTELAIQGVLLGRYIHLFPFLLVVPSCKIVTHLCTGFPGSHVEPALGNQRVAKTKNKTDLKKALDLSAAQQGNLTDFIKKMRRKIKFLNEDIAAEVNIVGQCLQAVNIKYSQKLDRLPLELGAIFTAVPVVYRVLHQGVVEGRNYIVKCVRKRIVGMCDRFVGGRKTGTK